MHSKFCIVVPQPHSHQKFQGRILHSFFVCSVQCRTLAFRKDHGGVWSKATALSILLLLFIVFLALLSAGERQCRALSVATVCQLFCRWCKWWEWCFLSSGPRKKSPHQFGKVCGLCLAQWWMGKTLSVARRLWDCMCVLWVCEGVSIMRSALVICVCFGECVCALWAPSPSYTA